MQLILILFHCCLLIYPSIIPIAIAGSHFFLRQISFFFLFICRLHYQPSYTPPVTINSYYIISFIFIVKFPARIHST